jgi:hypothetical protein
MIKNRGGCRERELVSFSLLAGNTESSQLIGEDRKKKLGDHLLNSAKSRMTQEFVPMTSRSPFTYKRVRRGRRGEEGSS